MTEGCDAITVSGFPNDERHDYFFELVYSATKAVGAGAILTSAHRQLPIRVFRSSALRGPYSATVGAVNASYFEHESKKTSSRCFRYDGLYTVKALVFHDKETGQTTEKDPTQVKVLMPGRQECYHFKLVRANWVNGVGIVAGPHENRRSPEQIMKFFNQEKIDEGRNNILAGGNNLSTPTTPPPASSKSGQ